VELVFAKKARFMRIGISEGTKIQKSASKIINSTKIAEESNKSISSRINFLPQ